MAGRRQHRPSAARAFGAAAASDRGRYDRELWRKIAHGEARVLFLPDKPDELRAAYAMSDEDLWRFLSPRKQVV